MYIFKIMILIFKTVFVFLIKYKICHGFGFSNVNLFYLYFSILKYCVERVIEIYNVKYQSLPENLK